MNTVGKTTTGIAVLVLALAVFSTAVPRSGWKAFTQPAFAAAGESGSVTIEGEGQVTFSQKAETADIAASEKPVAPGGLQKYTSILAALAALIVAILVFRGVSAKRK